MSMFRAAVAVAAPVLLFATARTGAAELQPPTLLHASGIGSAPTPGAANPTGSLTSCPSLPPAGPVDPARLVVRESMRPDVGPYSVMLTGYALNAASSAQDSYRPFLITASPGDTLRVDVVDQLARTEPVQGVVNFHTHGLVVGPRPCSPLGDYSFVEGQPGATTSYRVDIPGTLPGLMLGSGTQPQAYPSGLNWFHSHMHSRTAADVMNGQTGMLYIGDLRADLLAAPGLSPVSALMLADSDIRYLGLRDIQLAVPAGAEPDRVGTTTPAQRRTDDAYDSSLCPTESNPPQPAAPGEFAGPGYCGRRGHGAGAADTVWMFTVNGQYNPTLTLPSFRNQIWRVANLSANASYLLELADDASGRIQPLDVLSLDGLVAGTSTPGSTVLNVGVALSHVLLMPGARAEIFVPNVAGVQPRPMTLRTAGITTGPAGDPWPRIDLAHVVMQPTFNLVALLETSAVVPVVALPAAAPAMAPVQTAASAATPPHCISLPPGTTARRRITYLESGLAPSGQPQPFDFGFSSEVVTANGTPVDAGHTIAAQPFPMQAMLAPDSLPHICARLNSEEVWELVNTTAELHNFHIHQTRFRLSVQSDIGAPPNLVAIQDPTGFIAQYSPEVSGAVPGQSVDIWHDGLPIPPALLNPDGSVKTPGRTFITIPFFAQQQVGSFPYHCHILEHEDHGMMGVAQVYDPTQLASADQTSQLAALIAGSICRVPDEVR